MARTEGDGSSPLRGSSNMAYMVIWKYINIFSDPISHEKRIYEEPSSRRR